MKFGNFSGMNNGITGGFAGVGTSTTRPTALNVFSTYRAAAGRATAGGENAPRGLWFKPDGTQVFVVGDSANRIGRWTLTTAWDVSTAGGFVSSGQLANTAATVLTSVYGLTISSDGLTAIIVNATTNGIYKYTFGTAWDPTTITTTAAQENTTIFASNLTPTGVFSADGLTFNVTNIGVSPGARTYTTATAWNLAGLATTANSISDSAVTGIFFFDSGNKCVTSNNFNQTIKSYTVTTPYTLAGATLYNTALLNSISQPAMDIFVKSDGSAFWVVGDQLIRPYYLI